MDDVSPTTGQPDEADSATPVSASAAAEKLPPAWRPKVADTLAGFVGEVLSRPSQYSDEPVAVLVVDDGIDPHTVWCSSRALAEVAGRVDPGDFIAVRYDGTVPTRAGHGFKQYTVKITRGGVEL